MINAPQLLADLTRLLKRIEDDLRQRIEEVPELKASLQAEWQAARDADRCAETFETCRPGHPGRMCTGFLLSLRIPALSIEDNHLVERPWLAARPHPAAWP